jgi:hypothetical protein
MPHGWLVLSVSPGFALNGYFLLVLICMDKKEKQPSEATQNDQFVRFNAFLVQI